MDAAEATEYALVLIRTRPFGRWPEELRRWADLDPLLDKLDFTRTPSDTLQDVRDLRDALVIPLLATSDDDAARALNALSVAADLHPVLDIAAGQVRHQGRDERLATQLTAALVPPLMQARAAGLLRRIGVCADAACDTAFLDRSRNNRRRYCSTQCATRARVTEHRRRHTLGFDARSPG